MPELLPEVKLTDLIPAWKKFARTHVICQICQILHIFMGFLFYSLSEQKDDNFKNNIFSFFKLKNFCV